MRVGLGKDSMQMLLIMLLLFFQTRPWKSCNGWT